MKRIELLTSIFLLLFAVGVYAAGAPSTINYQGKLSSSGTPVDGTVDITFKLYSSSSGGGAIWSETQNSVAVSSGLFSVKLGSVTPFDSTKLPKADLWLGVKVGADDEMTPRKKLASSPFALKAATATIADSASSVDWSNVANIPVGISDGDDNTDTLAGLGCSTNEIAKWNGSAWACASLGAGSCSDGDFVNCYTGTSGTMSVAACTSGTRTCSGGSFGSCAGEVIDTTEICNSVDDDCDGSVDNSPSDGTTYYPDSDTDGYGDDSGSTVACTNPGSYVTIGGDCDDSDTAIYTGYYERCSDSKDNDCDLSTDEADCINEVHYIFASNSSFTGGVFGNISGADVYCRDIAAAGSASSGLSDAKVWRALLSDSSIDAKNRVDIVGSVKRVVGAAVIANDAADLWDGAIGVSVYFNENGVQPSGNSYWTGSTSGGVSSGVDCSGWSDSSAGVTGAYGSRTNITAAWFSASAVPCDAPSWGLYCISSPCDTLYYPDGDGDGYGDASVSAAEAIIACEVPSGYAANNSDCKDSDANQKPGATEMCGDGIDNNCDGQVDEASCTATHYTFITNSPTAGFAIGSLSNADVFCQSKATSGTASSAMGATWKAIMSDESTNAKDRLSISGPVLLLDGSTVATDAADLWDGTISTNININENGETVSSWVWTGTTEDGLKASGDTCNSWVGVGSGLAGNSTSTTSTWINGNSGSCLSSYRLYCISDLVGP